jgi:hypothetical protein
MNIAEISESIQSECDWDYVEWESNNRVRFDYNHGNYSFWLNDDGTTEGIVPNIIKPLLLGYGIKIA